VGVIQHAYGDGNSVADASGVVQHRESDLGDGLAYREAYTTTASARLEARWFATPFLQGSFILDCMPVYPGALPDTFSSV